MPPASRVRQSGCRAVRQAVRAPTRRGRRTVWGRHPELARLLPRISRSTLWRALSPAIPDGLSLQEQSRPGRVDLISIVMRCRESDHRALRVALIRRAVPPRVRRDTRILLHSAFERPVARLRRLRD